MAWDRNDYLTVLFIIALIVISILIAAMLLGAMPNINDFFKFKDFPPEKAASFLWLFSF